MLPLFIFRKICGERETKTVGVACPLMGTIATNVGKSIRTVRRSIAKLEELGIIKRVATKGINAADIVRTYMYFLHLQLTAWMTVCKCPLVKLRIMQLAVVKCAKNEGNNSF